jgi:cell division protein FtsB
LAKIGEKLLNVGLGAAIVYLSAQALTGAQGLGAFVELQAQVERLDETRAQLAVEQTALEHAASRLREDGLDADYLDERARALLAAGRDGELVFALSR